MKDSKIDMIIQQNDQAAHSNSEDIKSNDSSKAKTDNLSPDVRMIENLQLLYRLSKNQVTQRLTIHQTTLNF